MPDENEKIVRAIAQRRAVLSRIADTLALLTEQALELFMAEQSIVQIVQRAESRIDKLTAERDSLKSQLASSGVQPADRTALSDLTSRLDALDAADSTPAAPTPTPATPPPAQPGTVPQLATLPAQAVGAGFLLKSQPRGNGPGNILATPDGRPLYIFDGTNPDPSWTPYMVPAVPTGFDGLGTMSTPSGQQATAAGKPLFTFNSDTPNGPPSGDGANGQWHAITVA